MKHEMSRKEELRELKIKAREIQVRLDFLKMRIGEIQQGAPSICQWKAFVDAEKCVACGICKETCPVEAITVEECAQVDAQRCIGCGRCVQGCPQEALSLRLSVFTSEYKSVFWKRGNRSPISMFR